MRIWVLIAAALAAGFLTPRGVVASDTLDIGAELARPEVRLVVVEFYATWCEPCMAAVPKWKALHEKYRRNGLRFVVVSADDEVCSKPPDWSPDTRLCDQSGTLQKRLGVNNLPTSFLYSWEGRLSLVSHHVEPVESAIEAYFRDTQYTIQVEPVEVIGDKYAIGSNPEWVRDEVVTAVTKMSKFDVVSESRTSSPRAKSATCSVDLPANSTLRVKLQGYESGERQLSLELEKDGCVKSKSTQPYQGKGFDEDRESLKRAVQRATGDLLGQVVRVREAELVGGAAGGDWFTPAADLAVVTFRPDPPDAMIEVDGKALCKEQCSRDLAKGPHEITIRAVEYVTESRTVTVTGDLTIDWKLVPDFGWVSVSSEPSGLDVLVDDKPAGRTPVARFRVATGRHRVALASTCYRDQPKQISIDRGREEQAAFTPEPVEGGIEVKAVDDKGNTLRADVFVDGQKVGAAPGRFKVNVCAKRLEVKGDHGTFSQELSVQERQIASVNAVLHGGGGGTGVAGEVAKDEVEWVFSKPAKLEFTKSEVTVGQFAACVQAGACSKDTYRTRDTDWRCNWGHSDRSSHPMNCVNWHGADKFCRWVDGWLPATTVWRREASGNGDRQYPWGGQIVTCDFAVWGDGSNTDGCGRNGTWPVCSKPSGNSVSGLCDMSGNVWEWTSASDGNAAMTCGGSWFGSHPNHLVSDCRSGHVLSDTSNDDGGFRCVRQDSRRRLFR